MLNLSRNHLPTEVYYAPRFEVNFECAPPAFDSADFTEFNERLGYAISSHVDALTYIIDNLESADADGLLSEVTLITITEGHGGRSRTGEPFGYVMEVIYPGGSLPAQVVREWRDGSSFLNLEV